MLIKDNSLLVVFKVLYKGTVSLKLIEVREYPHNLLEVALTTPNDLYGEARERDALICFCKQLEKMVGGGKLANKALIPSLTVNFTSTSTPSSNTRLLVVLYFCPSHNCSSISAHYWFDHILISQFIKDRFHLIFRFYTG